MNIRLINTDKPTGMVTFLPASSSEEEIGSGKEEESNEIKGNLAGEVPAAGGPLQEEAVLSSQDRHLIGVAEDKRNSIYTHFTVIRAIENENERNRLFYEIAKSYYEKTFRSLATCFITNDVFLKQLKKTNKDIVLTPDEVLFQNIYLIEDNNERDKKLIELSQNNKISPEISLHAGNLTIKNNDDGLFILAVDTYGKFTIWERIVNAENIKNKERKHQAFFIIATDIRLGLMNRNGVIERMIKEKETRWVDNCLYHIITHEPDIYIDSRISYAQKITDENKKTEALITIAKTWPIDLDSYNEEKFNQVYNFALNDKTKLDMIIAIVNKTEITKEDRQDTVKEKLKSLRDQENQDQELVELCTKVLKHLKNNSAEMMHLNPPKSAQRKA